MNIQIEKNKLVEKIEKIDKIDIEKISLEELYEHVKDLMIGYSCVSFPARVSTVYRAAIDDKKRDFSKIDAFLYPPVSKTRLNRVNFPKEPCFYCSSDKDAAISEIGPRIGDIVFIMKSGVPLAAKLEIVGFGFLNKNKFVNRKTGSEIDWGKHKKIVLSKFLSSRPDKSKKEILKKKFELNTIVDDYFNAKFRKPIVNNESEYKITACVGKIYLYNPKGKTIDGIAYPSVAANYREVNWAFSPSAVDNSFTPKEFFKIEITNLTEKHYEYRVVDHTLYCKDDNVVWEGGEE